MFTDPLIHVAASIGKTLGDVGNHLHTTERKETPIVAVRVLSGGEP